LPGVEGAVQLVNSYEHDEAGYGAQAESATVRTQQNTKRLKKIALAESIVPPPNRFGPDSAPLSILCFGTTKMPALQALDWLAADGIAVNLLQIVTLAPFPAAEVSRFIDSAAQTLVIEGNATGQLEGLVREQCLRAPDHRLRRSDGRPFSPELIYATVSGLLGKPVTLTQAGTIAPQDGE
jgi:2-oxoglutarate ferredoxin oxidoreductase subunit alpha